MKRVLCIWFVLACAVGQVCSQTDKNLSRYVLCSLDANETVMPGEFQMELLKWNSFSMDHDDSWFSYVYTTINNYSRQSNIWVRNLSKVKDNESVRTYRIGPTLQKSVFVIKNNKANNGVRAGMEKVYAYGNPSSNFYDNILHLDDDGYVYSSKGVCYYSLYDQNQGSQIVWPIRNYSKGYMYFESSEGHFYNLVRDQYMPNTVLVVDDVPYELLGVYNEDNLKFKFSYNGKHWMAVGKECFWKDGVLKSVQGYKITDFLITNSGHYAYKAYEKANYGKGEVVVYDGQVVIRHADVRYFGMNAQGNLKFRFVSGDRYIQYENEKITDVTGEMASVYYPDEDKDKSVQVFSKNREHILSYRHGESSVEIDGRKVVDSEPCYAIYDQKHNAFVWNAIEEQNMGIELVVYRYVISDK